MKKTVLAIVWSVLLCSLSFQSAYGCSVVIEPLRKTFRRANAVFLADVTDIKSRDNVDYKKTLIDGDISFRIINSWKGNYKNNVTLAGNVGWACGCSSPNEFKVGMKYVVTVDKNANANFCSSTDAHTEYGKHLVARLDNFWFRLWAELYPF